MRKFNDLAEAQSHLNAAVIAFKQKGKKKIALEHAKEAYAYLEAYIYSYQQ